MRVFTSPNNPAELTLLLLLPALVSLFAVLMPGYFAAAMDGPVVTSTVICPQGYYCPGGAANASFTPLPVGANRRLLQVEGQQIVRCSTGWTVDVGSTSVEQCCE